MKFLQALLCDNASPLKRRGWILFFLSAVAMYGFAAAIARYGLADQDMEYYLWLAVYRDAKTDLILQAGSASLTRLVWALSFGSMYILRLWILGISFAVSLITFTMGTRRTPRDATLTIVALFFLGVLSVYLFDSAYWAIHVVALISTFTARYLLLEKRSAKWVLGVLCGVLVVIRVPSSWICCAVAFLLLGTVLPDKTALKRRIYDVLTIAGVALATVLLFMTWYAGSPLAFVQQVFDFLASMPPRYSGSTLLSSYLSAFEWWVLPGFLSSCLLCLCAVFFGGAKKVLFLVLAVFLAYIEQGKILPSTPEPYLARMLFAICMVTCAVFCLFWHGDRTQSWREKAFLFILICITCGVTIGSDSWPLGDMGRPVMLTLPLFFLSAPFKKRAMAKCAFLVATFAFVATVALPFRYSHMTREGKHTRLFSPSLVSDGVKGYEYLLTSSQNAAWHQRMDTLITTLNDQRFKLAAIGSFGNMADFLAATKGIQTLSTTEFWRTFSDKATREHLRKLFLEHGQTVAILLYSRKPECRWSDSDWGLDAAWPTDYYELDQFLMQFGYRVMLPYGLEPKDSTLLALPTSALTEKGLESLHLKLCFP